jgi:hypothetical protein
MVHQAPGHVTGHAKVFIVYLQYCTLPPFRAIQLISLFPQT